MSLIIGRENFAGRRAERRGKWGRSRVFDMESIAQEMPAARTQGEFAYSCGECQVCFFWVFAVILICHGFLCAKSPVSLGDCFERPAC